MNQEWKRPTSWQVRAIPLSLLAAVIIAAFVYMESHRSERLIDASFEFVQLLDGTVIAMKVEAPEVTADHWDRITSLKQSKEVSIQHAERFEGGLEPLASLPHLRWLRFVDCASLREDDVAWMAGALSLERLDVVECPAITDASVATLIDWKSLQEVDLWGTPITLAGLSQLREARRDLKIFMNWHAYVPQSSDFRPFHAPNSPHGDRIAHFSARLESSADVQAMHALLSVHHNWESGEWDDHPKRQIRELDLSGPFVGPALPELARQFPDVSGLSLSDARIARDVGDWSANLKRLELLNLTADSDLSGVADCASINVVKCKSNLHFVDAELNFVKHLPDLKFLEMEGSEQSRADVEAISRLSKLHYLRLDGVTDETITPLLDPQVLPDLFSLQLGNSEVSAETLERLRAAHPTAEIKLATDL